MIYEIVKPFKHDPNNSYLKCLGSRYSCPNKDARDVWEILFDIFPRYTPCIVNFDGFENCLRIATKPAPFISLK